MASTPPDDPSPPNPGSAEGPKYTCTVRGCGNPFDTRRDLENHRVRSHPLAKIPCSQCSRVFATPQGLQAHFGKQHKPKPFRCSMCSKAYTERNGLSFHEKEHQSRPHMCQVQDCQKLFKTQKELEKHVETQHPKKAFSKDNIKVFPKSEAPDPRKRYKCPYCDHWADNKSHCEEHIDNVHNKTVHPCAHCDKVFKSSRRMRDHVKNFHPDQQLQVTQTTDADTAQEGTVGANIDKTYEDFYEEKLKKTRRLYAPEVRQGVTERLASIRTAVDSRLNASSSIVDASQRLIIGVNLFRYEKAQLVEPFPSLTPPTLESHANLEHILKQPSRRTLYADYTVQKTSRTVSHIQIKNVPGKLSKSRDEEAWFDVTRWKLDQANGTVMGDFLRGLLARLPVRLSELPDRQKQWVLFGAMCLGINNTQDIKLKLPLPNLMEDTTLPEEVKSIYRVQVVGYDHTKNNSWTQGVDVRIGAIDIAKQVSIKNEERYDWVGSPSIMPSAMSYKFTQPDYDKALEVAKLLGSKYVGFVGSREELLQDARHTISRFSHSHRQRLRDDYELKTIQQKARTSAWTGETLWFFAKFATHSVFTPSPWMSNHMRGRDTHLILHSVEPERLFSIAYRMLEAKKSGHTEDEVWGIGALIADIEERRGLAPSEPIPSCNESTHSDELHICPECMKIKPHKDLQVSEYRYFKICSACHFSFEDENKKVKIEGGIVGFHLYEHLKRENVVAKIKEPATKTKAYANAILKALSHQKIDQHRYHDGYANQELSLIGKKNLTWDGVRLNPLFPSVDAIDPVVAGSDGRTRYHYMDNTVNNFIITSDALNRAVKHYPKVMLYALRLFMDAPKSANGKDTYETATAIARNCLINHYEYGALGRAQQTYRIGQQVPSNMAAITDSFRNAQLLPRTQPKEKVFRIHGTKQSGNPKDRLSWRPKHYEWLIAQIKFIETDVFGDSAAAYRKHWMRADANGTDIFCPASTYCVTIDLTWLDIMEMFAIKSDRNLTMCQRPHASFSPPVQYSVEELVLIVANVYLRMIKTDVDANRPEYELGRDELGLVPHLNINSLLCASLGHRWPGQSQNTGLLNFNLNSSDKVDFDPQVCGFMWETQVCNFLKFKYSVNILEERVLSQVKLIRRGTPLRGETREILPAKDLVVALNNEYDFQLDKTLVSVDTTASNEALDDLVISQEVQDSIDQLQAEVEQEALATSIDPTTSASHQLPGEKKANHDDFVDDYDEDIWISAANVLDTTPAALTTEDDYIGDDDEDNLFWQSVAASADGSNAAFVSSSRCQMVNIGATCYMSAPLHILANIPELNNALTTQVGFRSRTGRDPGLLSRIRDETGIKHIELHDQVCDLLATLVVDGPRLGTHMTRSILNKSNAIQNQWKNEADDAASFLTFLLEALNLRLDQSRPIEGSFILEKNDRGGFNRRIPYRPEEYQNMLHYADLVEGKPLPSLKDFVDEHWNAHKQSGYDSPLNDCTTIQSLRISQCDSPFCGAIQRDVVYSNTISLRFSPSTKDNAPVSLYDLMRHTFQTNLDPAPRCLNHAKHTHEQPGKRHDEITRVTRVGSIFMVEIDRTRPFTLDQSMTSATQQASPELENEPFLNRLTDYESFEMFDWVNGGPTLASKDLTDSETYQHDLLTTKSLTSDYEVHAIIAYRRQNAHYTAFVKVDGEWIYFDDTALTPTVRSPFSDWPEGFVETVLFYKRSNDDQDIDARVETMVPSGQTSTDLPTVDKVHVGKEQELAQLREQLNLKSQQIEQLQKQLSSMSQQSELLLNKAPTDQSTISASPSHNKPLPDVPDITKDDAEVLLEPSKARKGTFFSKFRATQIRKEDNSGKVVKRTASGRHVRRRSLGNVLTDFLKQPFTGNQPQASSAVTKSSWSPSPPPHTTEKLVPPSVISRRPREGIFDQPATLKTRHGQQMFTPGVILPRSPQRDIDTDEGSLTDMGEPPATPTPSAKDVKARLQRNAEPSSDSTKKFRIRKDIYSSAGRETASTPTLIPQGRRLALGTSPSTSSGLLTRSPALQNLAAADSEGSLQRGKKRKQPTSHVSDSEVDDEDRMDTEED